MTANKHKHRIERISIKLIKELYMRRKIDRITIFGAFVSLVMVGSTSVVMALAYGPASNVAAKPVNTPTSAKPVTTPAPAPNQQTAPPSTAQNARSNATNKSTVQQEQARLRVCSNRQAAITKIMSNITNRVNNQLSLFSNIALNVENFYNSSNSKQTLSNYSQLVQNINQAKLQATNDATTLGDNANFSCSSSNPKAMVTTFQGYLKTEINDLQNYRTSVKNLIVAVAKANGLTIKNSGN